MHTRPLSVALFLLSVAMPAQALDTLPPIVASAEPSWLETLKQGGIIIIVQLLLSVLGGGFILERCFHLKRKAVLSKDTITKARALWDQQKYDELADLKHTAPSIATEIISFLATHRQQSPGDLSTSAGDIAARELEIHTQKVYPIAVVATLEPLIGLLGTVVGMMAAFKTVASVGALGDASLLAGDISMALITTAVGLAISVPFLGIYHFFKSRIALYTADLEKEITDLISDWFMKDQ